MKFHSPPPSSTTLISGFCSLAALGGRLLINLIGIPNFTTMGGLGVAEGSKSPLWRAGLWSIAALFGSDLILWWMRGFPIDYFIMAIYVYPAMLGYVALGWLLAKNNVPWRLGLASLLGSVLFFLITNFGVWQVYKTQYAADLSGLLHAYVLALPFAGWTILGDVTFTAVFASIHGWAARQSMEAVGPDQAFPEAN